VPVRPDLVERIRGDLTAHENPSTGSQGERTLRTVFSEDVARPGGLASDAKGNLWVCSASKVTVINPMGQVIAQCANHSNLEVGLTSVRFGRALSCARLYFVIPP
jgi:sugar lactone lactonase YvrE